MAAGWAWIRRHWLFLTLFALGLALRIMAMVAYQPVLLYIDSVASYLDALPRLNPAGQDPVGYDILLLRPVLAVGPLGAVAAVQHLFGLGIAGLTYALLLRKTGAGTAGWRALAALATAPVLLDAYQVQIEQMVMSDPLFEALVVGAFALLAWSDRPNRWQVAVAGLLLGLGTTVRAVGEVTILAVLLYVLLASRAWRTRAALGGVAVVSFAVPVLLYAAYFHHVTGRWGLTNVAGKTIYGRVATFADCTGLALPAYERPLCPSVPLRERLGPDYWANWPDSPANKPITTPPGMTANQVLQDFSLRVIRHQPVEFARSVLFDAARLFSWQRTDGRDAGQPPVARWQFQTGNTWYPPIVTAEVAAAEGARYGGGPARVVVPPARVLRWYQLHGGYTPGPVIGLCLVLALVGAFRRSGLRPVILLYLLGTVLLVLLSDAFLFSWRYQLPVYLLLPPAAVLALAALRRARSEESPS